MGELQLGGGDGDVQLVLLRKKRNVLTEEAPDGLLQHPSSVRIFHLHPVGCYAMADTTAEVKGLIGRMEMRSELRLPEMRCLLVTLK